MMIGGLQTTSIGRRGTHVIGRHRYAFRVGGFGMTGGTHQRGRRRREHHFLMIWGSRRSVGFERMMMKRRTIDRCERRVGRSWNNMPIPILVRRDEDDWSLFRATLIPAWIIIVVIQGWKRQGAEPFCCWLGRRKIAVQVCIADSWASMRRCDRDHFFERPA